MNDTGPSRWFYGLAVLIALAGSAVFVVFLFGTLGGLARGLQRITVPGSHEIRLDKAGTYFVYHENRSVRDGTVPSAAETLSGLQCAVRHKASGEKVRLGPASANSEYALGGRAGKAILQFSIDEPGIYEFAAWYEDGGGDIVLAVGQDFTMKIFASIFGGIGILFGSWVIAGIIFLITLVKRKRAGKALSTGGS